MKIIKISVIICGLVVLFASCKKGGFCYKPDGNIVTEERQHTDFSSISLGLPADLYVEQSENYSVKIEASQNLMEIIETKVKGSKLKIDLKKRKCIKNNDNIKIYVTLPGLKDLSISGSGDIFIPKKISGDQLGLSVSGSGSVTLDSLDYAHFDMNISGSGELYLTGIDTAESQDIRIDGSGEVNAFSMPVKKSGINVSGSGECDVYVMDDLDVKISGSGDVRYKGHPYVNKSVSGSGSVKPF